MHYFQSTMAWLAGKLQWIRLVAFVLTALGMVVAFRSIDPAPPDTIVIAAGRTDGAYYLAGCPPDDDPAVDYDDFEPDHSLWEEKVWNRLCLQC